MAPRHTSDWTGLLLIYRPRKDERLSWLTCSGRFTHIVVTRRLQAERRTGSVRRPKTGVLPTVLRNQPNSGIKIWTDLSSVLSQSTRLTDRQTAFSSLDRVCIQYSTVEHEYNVRCVKTLGQVSTSIIITFKQARVRGAGVRRWETVLVEERRDVLRLCLKVPIDDDSPMFVE